MTTELIEQLQHRAFRSEHDLTAIKDDSIVAVTNAVNDLLKQVFDSADGGIIHSIDVDWINIREGGDLNGLRATARRTTGGCGGVLSGVELRTRFFMPSFDGAWAPKEVAE